MRRLAVRLCVGLTGLVTLAGCTGGSSGERASTSATQGAPAIDACLHAPSARQLTRATTVDCRTTHEGQVYALIGLPAGLTDPSVRQQVSRALPRLGCPSLKAWLGYTGEVPLGLLQTWQFPTKQRIAAGARWTACVAIRSPGPDHDKLGPLVGSYAGKLVGVRSPLPQLGRCAPTHTNTRFTSEFCRRGSTQWVWLGAHVSPGGAFPGLVKTKATAHAACDRLVRTHGGGAAFVYYPVSALGWTRSKADWSCWMPLAHVTS